jgi:hypothetical protein
MASETGGLVWDETFICHTSSGINKYCVVTSTGAGDGGYLYIGMCLSATAGANGPIGILQDDLDASEPGRVRIMGISKAATVAVVAANAVVTCSTDATAVSAATSGQKIIGRALTASATTSGEIIEVMLYPGGMIM